MQRLHTCQEAKVVGALDEVVTAVDGAGSDARASPCVWDIPACKPGWGRWRRCVGASEVPCQQRVG